MDKLVFYETLDGTCFLAVKGRPIIRCLPGLTYNVSLSLRKSSGNVHAHHNFKLKFLFTCHLRILNQLNQLVFSFLFFLSPSVVFCFFSITINCGCNKCLLSAHLETFSSLMFLRLFLVTTLCIPSAKFPVDNFPTDRFLLTASSAVLSVIENWYSVRTHQGRLKMPLRQYLTA